LEIDSIDRHALFLLCNKLITRSLAHSPVVEVQHISISPIRSPVVYKYIPHMTILS